MTWFDGAVIREQGVTVAVVIVRPSLLQNTTGANRATPSFQPVFLGMPVILMTENSCGRPRFQIRSAN
jgi:hypothetical protein